MNNIQLKCNKLVIVVVILLFLSNISFAQSIKGTLIDINTSEPLTGAAVTLNPSNKTTLVKLDGSFKFVKLPAGTYELVITSTSYKTITKTIDLSANENKILNIVAEPITSELQSITITAQRNEDKNARHLEKIANPIINVLSAKTIQLLPDITVANALQRVSGVTIERSGSGEARYPIIRGMEKRYINTLVNGVKIPSPDNRNRFIPLDLFPSELLERLEVIKSLTPSMEGDAIGGTINLVMKDALTKKLLQANFSTGYNNTFGQDAFQKFSTSTINKQSPAEISGPNSVATLTDFSSAQLNYSDKGKPLNTTVGVSFGNRFGKVKKLGFIISGSYQNIFRGTTSNFFLPNSQPGLNNIPLFSNLQLRRYSVQSNRIGVNTKFDYVLNKNNKLSLATTVVSLNDYQTRRIWDTIALNSLVSNSFRSQWQYLSIISNNLQGIHNIGSGIKLDWNVVYSTASNHIPDQAQFVYETPVVAGAAPIKLQSMSRIWQNNKDNDGAVYLNVTKDLKLLKKEFELKAGGLYRNKTRDNLYNAYTISPTVGALYTNINNASFLPFDINAASGKNGKPATGGNGYTFNEKVSAAYIQGKWQLTQKLELLGGVRIEGTNQNYESSLTKFEDAKTGRIWYTDILPSAQLKYAINKSQNIRFAYYKALARPQFAEMIPDGIDDEFFKQVGDPVNLKHSVADNIDLRYEYYTQNAGQILLGVFYKKVNDPIEIAAVKPLNINSLYLQPVNIGNATNYGFEAVVTKYFGPFGITANYTYTKSSITNDSLIYSARNSAGINVSSRVSETRPLQGQSNHIGNLSLIYKNPKIGLDVQVAGVYTGERIFFISPYLGLNYWQAPTTQLDFSFEKRIVKKFTVYGKITNITNTPYELYLKIPYSQYLGVSGSRPLALQTDPDNKIIIQKDYYKTNFLFGFRYKF